MGATVVIACSLPHGLKVAFPTQLEGKPPLPEEATKTYAFAGANSDISKRVGKYAFTENVDKDWFDAWSKNSRDFVPLKKGMIFAQPTLDDARAKAREMQGEATGFEGLDPLKEGVEPTDEMKKQLAGEGVK